MGQIITTQNLVATKVVRHAGQQVKNSMNSDIITTHSYGPKFRNDEGNCKDFCNDDDDDDANDNDDDDDGGNFDERKGWWESIIITKKTHMTMMMIWRVIYLGYL